MSASFARNEIGENSSGVGRVHKFSGVMIFICRYGVSYEVVYLWCSCPLHLSVIISLCSLSPRSPPPVSSPPPPPHPSATTVTTTINRTHFVSLSAPPSPSLLIFHLSEPLQHSPFPLLCPPMFSHLCFFSSSLDFRFMNIGCKSATQLRSYLFILSYLGKTITRDSRFEIRAAGSTSVKPLLQWHLVLYQTTLLWEHFDE